MNTYDNFTRFPIWMIVHHRNTCPNAQTHAIPPRGKLVDHLELPQCIVCLARELHICTRATCNLSNVSVFAPDPQSC